MIKEKLMNSVGQRGTYPSNRTKRVGAGAQMRLGAQVFKGVAFFGNGITFGVVYVADNDDLRCLYFQRLALAFGLYLGAADVHRAASR